MNAPDFITAGANKQPLVHWPLFQTVLLTHHWKTLHSCLFNYANAHIYKRARLVISRLNWGTRV